MSDEPGSGPEPPARGSRTPASRLLGVGARGAERIAAATGVNEALDDAIEEAIVRAMRSPGVERAVVRVIEQSAVQDAVRRTLASDEVADAIVDALDTELADRVWVELLASDKAQMLVERIAEAPEVRAAIAEQGVGLITDVGRRLTRITEAMDDAAERFAHRVVGRSGEETETNQVGFVTRALASGVDVLLGVVLFWIVSGIFASVAPVAFGEGDGLPLWAAALIAGLGLAVGGSILVAFWSLVGQTPGMRFLSIHLEADGSREIGLGRAIKRMVGFVLALLPAGLGFLAILFSPTRQGWHDRIAGTEVVYDAPDVAPWSRSGPSRSPGARPPSAGASGRRSRA